ncbi:hypothetical protein O3M35_001747 [Rhynocoris fuscipes]|uniref:Chemosensory protein n=1 Tax=Rhynocoris fuscipes TaxID=488301 RepID=A0AAW1CQ08_9HEMI
MKATAVLVFTAILATFISVSSAYTTQYDNIDIDQILNNDRIYQKYLDCLLDKGACTPDGKALKEALPDALETGCEKCTDKQKDGTRKILKFVTKNKPDDFKAIATKYDPEGKFKVKYAEMAKKEGIEIPEY